MTVGDVRPAAPRSPALFFGRASELSRFAAEMTRVRMAVVYGAGGVGKTAFALRAAELLADRLGAERVYVRCRAGESASTLASAALDHVAPDATGRARPVDALIEAGPVVLVVDDVHLADATSITEVAEYLVTRSDRLYVCMTSRSVLSLSPVAVDHLVVRLGGLDGAAARDLWSALESLYGQRPVPSARDEASGIAGGNPLLIKRAFAEVEPEGDPLGLEELDQGARDLLVELCALRRPASRATLVSGREAAAGAALTLLERRFLVELSRSGDREGAGDLFGVHDVVREAVEASRFRPSLATHARCIAYYRANAANDEGALVELIHHAARSGDDTLTLELLLAESDQIRRVPPGSTLLDQGIHDAVDRLEERGTLPIALRLLRARVRARHGEMREAWRELEAIREPSTELECDRAEVANMLGLSMRARASAQQVLDDPNASPLAHVRALVVAIEAERALGDTPRALEIVALESPPLAALGPFLEGVRAWLRAVVRFDGEQYAEAAAEMKRAREILTSNLPLEATPMLRPLERANEALLGSESPAADEAGELFDDSAFFRSLARLLRAQEHLARGRPRRAAELAEQTRSVGREIDCLPIVSWATWVWAQAACALGDFESVLERVPETLAAVAEVGHFPPRVRLELALAEASLATGLAARALELAQGAEERAEHLPRSRRAARALAARARGALGMEVTTVSRDSLSGIGDVEALAFDIDRALARGDLPGAASAAEALEVNATRFGWAELASRASVARAECSLRRGDVASARAHLDRHAARATAEGYAHARVHAAAIRAALGRAERGAALAGPELVHHWLAEIGLDRPWARAAFDDLAARLHLLETPTLELATSGGNLVLVRAQLPELELEADLVVDRERGWIRFGGQKLDLSRRSTLLDLLVVLANPPGAWVTPADLAQRAWQLDYHALKHHSRLAMGIARVREVLGAEAVEGGRDGYRLAETSRWAVLRPL